MMLINMHGSYVSTDALESLQPSQLLPVGAGHDYRRRTYDCLLYHATRRTGAGSALGHFRRGPLSLERDDDRPVACGIRNLARPRSSLRHWSRHQTFRREAGHYRRHGGRRAGLRLAGVRDARLDGLPHYDSSRFRRHRDARVAGHAVQAGR